jgi:hypothetical protein
MIAENYAKKNPPLSHHKYCRLMFVYRFYILLVFFLTLLKASAANVALFLPGTTHALIYIV